MNQQQPEEIIFKSQNSNNSPQVLKNSNLLVNSKSKPYKYSSYNSQNSKQEQQFSDQQTPINKELIQQTYAAYGKKQVDFDKLSIYKVQGQEKIDEQLLQQSQRKLEIQTIVNKMNKQQKTGKQIVIEQGFFSLCTKRQQKPKKAQPVKNSKIEDPSSIQKQQIQLDKMDQEERMNKAIRHYFDAIYYRSVRHDIDKKNQKFIRFVWGWQNSKLWNDFLLLLSWVLLSITFFEPVNRLDQSMNDSDRWTLFTIELIILVLIWTDFCLDLILKASMNQVSIRYIALGSKKSIFRFIFLIILLTDFITFQSSYPQNRIRFSRLLRPFLIVLYSKDMRRSMKGILKSGKDLLIIFFFYFVIIIIWAYVGMQLIGDISDQIVYDKYAWDYNDLMRLANSLYIISTNDLYPDVMIPSLYISKYYLLYFVPFIIIFLLVCQSIPVAVVYEGYKNNRMELVLSDRIKRQSALLACFITIDEQSLGYLNTTQFIQFFTQVYENIYDTFNAFRIATDLNTIIDQNNNNEISIEEFFQVIDIQDEFKMFSLNYIKTPQFWSDFREWVDSNFNIEEFVNGFKWTYFVLLITLSDSILALLQFWVTGLDDNNVLQIFDYIFLSVYISDILLKIIAIGVYNFFDDNWNIFDLVLATFQILFDLVLLNIISGGIQQSVQAGRLLKLTKMQKVFKLFRAFRSIKILSFFAVGFEIFNKVSNLMYKVMLCLPIVLKLSTIFVIVFYIYATIGVELFTTFPGSGIRQDSPYQNQLCDVNQKDPHFAWGTCYDFNSFLGAFLQLLMVSLQSGWGNIMFDNGYKRDSMALSAIYFDSFQFLSVFILSLIGGLIWEIFNLISSKIEQQEEDEDEKNRQNQINNDKHDLQGQQQNQQPLVTGSLRKKIGNIAKAYKNSSLSKQNLNKSNDEKKSEKNGVENLENLADRMQNKLYSIQVSRVEEQTQHPNKKEEEQLEGYDYKENIDLYKNQIMKTQIRKVNMLTNNKQSVLNDKKRSNKASGGKSVISQTFQIAGKQSLQNQKQFFSKKFLLWQEQVNMLNPLFNDNEYFLFTENDEFFKFDTKLDLDYPFVEVTLDSQKNSKLLKVQFNKISKFNTSSSNENPATNQFREIKKLNTLQQEQQFQINVNVISPDQHVQFQANFKKQNGELEVFEEQQPALDKFEADQRPLDEKTEAQGNKNEQPQTNKDQKIYDVVAIIDQEKEAMHQLDSSLSAEICGERGNTQELLKVVKVSSIDMEKINKLKENQSIYKDQLSSDLNFLSQNSMTKIALNKDEIEQHQIKLCVKDDNQLPNINNINQIRQQSDSLDSVEYDEQIQKKKTIDKQTMKQTNEQLQNDQLQLNQAMKQQLKLKLISHYKVIIKNNQFINHKNSSSHLNGENNQNTLEVIPDYSSSPILEDLAINIQKSLRQNHEAQLEQKMKEGNNLSDEKALLNQALMQGTDKKKLEQNVISHFQNIYGRQFASLLEFNILEYWEIQSKALFHLNNILKFQYFNIKYFMQILQGIEIQLSEILTNKKCFIKFLYQSTESKQNWFTIKYIKGLFMFEKILHGPWRYFNDVFSQDAEIYLSQDIFHSVITGSQYIKHKMEQFFLASKAIGDSSDYAQLQMNQACTDVLFLPIKNMNIEKTTKDLVILNEETKNQYLDNAYQDVSLDEENLQVIQNMIVVIYIEKTVKIKLDIEKIKHLNLQENEINNTNNGGSNGATNKIESGDNQSGITQYKPGLSFPYIYELLSDLKSILVQNRDTMFLKLSEMLYYRQKFNKMCKETN